VNVRARRERDGTCHEPGVERDARERDAGDREHRAAVGRRAEDLDARGIERRQQRREARERAEADRGRDEVRVQAERRRVHGGGHVRKVRVRVCRGAGQLVQRRIGRDRQALVELVGDERLRVARQCRVAFVEDLVEPVADGRDEREQVACEWRGGRGRGGVADVGRRVRAAIYDGKDADGREQDREQLVAVPRQAVQAHGENVREEGVGVPDRGHVAEAGRRKAWVGRTGAGCGSTYGARDTEANQSRAGTVAPTVQRTARRANL
jgi:hypothetical protein